MQNTRSWQWTLFWVSMFSIAMGYLECTVVVYLREIYYPFGFDFPVASFDEHIANIEIGREISTLIMLLSIGIIAGKTALQKFAYFIYSFAIWDIFYYVFLYLLIDWPQSFFTWDILFLLPLVWTGPVIAPLIISVTMIFLGLIILKRTEKNSFTKLGFISWLCLITGSVIIVVTFTLDFTQLLLEKYNYDQLLQILDFTLIHELLYDFTPNQFNWWLFISGEIVLVAGILLIRSKRNKV